MLRIFGILDLIVVLMIIARVLQWNIPIEMLVLVLIIHFLKALIYFDVFGSLTDIGSGLALILSFFINIPYLLIIAAVLLGIKSLITIFTFQ